jgi:leucyl aminopeptidase
MLTLAVISRSKGRASPVAIAEESMKIAFAKPELPETGSLAVGVMDGRKLGSHAAQIEKLTKGAVNRAIGASRFKGGTEDHLTLLAPAGVPVNRVLLIGLGTAQKLDALAAQAIGGRLVAAFNAAGEKEATVLIEAIPSGAIASTSTRPRKNRSRSRA